MDRSFIAMETKIGDDKQVVQNLVPIFSGDDPRFWVLYMEVRFLQYDSLEPQKLKFAEGYIAGEARAWFQWRQSLCPFCSWEGLKRGLLLRFGNQSGPERTRAVLEDQRFLDEMIDKQKEDQELEATDAKESIQVNSSPLEPGLTISATNSQGLASMMPNRETVMRKMYMPVCDGKNPHGWIAQAERYFRISQFPEDKKLPLVSLSLEGDALKWYNEELTREAFTDWREFKTRLLARFSPIKKQFPQEVITESKSFSKKEAFTATKLVQVKKSVREKESITGNDFNVSQFQEIISKSESDEEETDVIQDNLLKFDTDSLLASDSIPTLETKIIASNMAVTCVTKTQENSDFVNDDFLVVHDEFSSVLLQPFDYMASSVGMNSVHSLITEVAETAEMSQDLIVLTRLECAHEGKIRSGMKRKCFKSWKFKFKKKSLLTKVTVSRSLVTEHQQILSKSCRKYGFYVWHCWRYRTLQKLKLAKLQLKGILRMVAKLTSKAMGHTDSDEFTDVATIAKSATSSRTIAEDNEKILGSLLHDFNRESAATTEIQNVFEQSLQGYNVWKEFTQEYSRLQFQCTSQARALLRLQVQNHENKGDQILQTTTPETILEWEYTVGKFSGLLKIKFQILVAQQREQKQITVLINADSLLLKLNNNMLQVQVHQKQKNIKFYKSRMFIYKATQRRAMLMKFLSCSRVYVLLVRICFWIARSLWRFSVRNTHEITTLPLMLNGNDGFILQPNAFFKTHVVGHLKVLICRKELPDSWLLEHDVKHQFILSSLRTSCVFGRGVMIGSRVKVREAELFVLTWMKTCQSDGETLTSLEGLLLQKYKWNGCIVILFYAITERELYRERDC